MDVTHQHGSPNEMTKHKVAVFNLDPEQGQWWEWHKNQVKNTLVGVSLLQFSLSGLSVILTI